jgi:hypothetical protein
MGRKTQELQVCIDRKEQQQPQNLLSTKVFLSKYLMGGGGMMVMSLSYCMVVSFY